MLYLCLSLPQLPLEARQPASEDPIAVVERHGARRWLIACNEACHRAGMRPGMDATTAMALLPVLRLIERSGREEAAALKSLAAWAEQFSSWVTFDAARQLLWIEIRSGLRYFGGIEEIRNRIEQGLAQLGYVGYVGIAPTLEAAALLSQLNNAPVIRRRDELVRSLEPLPIAGMYLADDVADTFAGLGLRTVSNVLALPRDTVARRFDAGLLDYLDRLTGKRPDPRKQFQTPKQYRRRFEFLGSVETTQGLQFPLKRMFDELQGYLIARDTAVQEVHLVLGHEGQEPTQLDIRTSRPMRDAARLRTLAHERLERVVLDRGVVEIVLRADRFEPLGDTQLELLDSSRQKDSGWEDHLDRLRARWGDGAVRQLALKDDHRPEHAWCVAEGKTEAPKGVFRDRPMWLLPPEPIRFPLAVVGRPERIESGWWDGTDEQRDYFVARAPDGSQLWVFRDAQGQWYVQGKWA